MDRDKQATEKIKKIGNEAFEKLETLQVPPYPKYYYDTFMNLLSKPNNRDVFDLSKKFNYLFSSGDVDSSMAQNDYLNITKKSISSFEDSNIALKHISNENIIDIETIRNDPKSIDTNKILLNFNNFQNQIMEELENADKTIESLKIQIEKLERESNIDALTKTYNRRVLIKDLEDMLKAGNDRDLDMQLILFDADDFKKINDTFGHIAGDKTLIYMTRLIYNSIRKGIRVYRYGGEEFIILLNRSQKEDAIKATQRIIKNADESKLLYKGNTIHLTLSAGISNHIKGDTPSSIIDRADKALYVAKNSGKNCYKIG